MLKKQITYNDVDGIQRTDTFYFNLTKAEIIELEVSHEGGSFSEHLKSIAANGQPKEIMSIFRELIMTSYGERTPDGRGFMKSSDLSTAFGYSEAYSELFMELCTDAGAAVDFINGVMPPGLISEADRIKAMADARGETPSEMQEQAFQREQKLQELRMTEEAASSEENARNKAISDEELERFHKWQQDQAHDL